MFNMWWVQQYWPQLSGDADGDGKECNEDDRGDACDYYYDDDW